MKRIWLALFALALAAPASAQNAGWPPPAGAMAGLGVYNTSPPTLTNGQVGFNQLDASGNLRVAATVSVSGFAPGGAFASLTATGSSADVALPAGAVVAFQNTGTTTVSCTLSVGAGSAVAGENQIPASSTVYFTVGSNTHGSCIDESGSASNVVRLSGGTGIGTGFGGGGGGGGGGAITAASGSYSSGALASGSIASGAIVDGTSGAWKTQVVDGSDVNLFTSGNPGYVNGVGIASGTTDVARTGTGVLCDTTISPSYSAAQLSWVTCDLSGNMRVAAISGAFAAGSQVDLLTMRGTKAAGTAAANSILAGGVYNSTAPTLTNGQQASLQLGPHGGLLIEGAGYPAGSTPITISGTGTTGATTATLATGASVTTYICGFSIRANATAAATGNATVTGTITGTLNFTQWTAPNASGLGVTEMIFTPCVPASAVNTGIAIISAAPGTGGVVSVTGWGYTL